MRQSLVLLIWLIPCMSLGHPSHVTLMEIEIDGGRMEASLQLHRADLARALAKTPGTQNLETAVRSLIKSDVILRDKTGKTLPFDWVGIEEGKFSVWAYFQWDTKSVLAGHTMTQQLLIGVHPDIVHTLNIVSKGQRASLTFNKDITTHPLPLIVTASGR